MAAQPLPTPPTGTGHGPTPGDAVTWWGHATTVIELDGTALLTDPLLRPGVGPFGWGPLRWAHARPPHGLARQVSAVLISHLHHDHLDLPSLASVPPGVPIVVPAGGGRYLTRHLRADVVEVVEGEELAVGEVTVQAVHARHDGRRWPLGPPVAALGYLVTGPARPGAAPGPSPAAPPSTGAVATRPCVYFAGDTDLYPAMAELAEHGLTLALLPVGGWGLSLGEGHLDAHRAARALQLLRPAAAVPIHWGGLRVPVVWRSRPHLFHTPGTEFAEHAAELAPDVQVLVSELGDRVALPEPRR